MMTQIPLGQQIHAVIMRPRVHRIAHEHRVIDRRNTDTKTREYLRIVLHVLPDLQNRFVLQHRLQDRQRLVKVHLPLGQIVRAEQVVRRRCLVYQRQIPRVPRLDAETDAHEIRRHLVQPRGLGVDGDIPPCMGLRDPGFQRFSIRNRLIDRVIKGRQLRCVRLSLFRLDLGNHRHLGPKRLGDALGDRPELHGCQEPQQILRHRLFDLKAVDVVVQIHVAIERHQLL